MENLYVELPDSACRWAGDAMIGVDGGTICASTPQPLPADKARELYRRLIDSGQRASLYRKRGRRLTLAH